MSIGEKVLLAFNRGVVSKRGLARLDLERMSMSAAQQTNWMPRVLGSMMLRPGMKMIDQMYSEDRPNGNLTRQMPFVFGVDDTTLIEFGSERGIGADQRGKLRFRVNDVLLVRPTVSTTIPDGDFTSTFTFSQWNDDSDLGATAAIGSAATPNFTCNLTGTGDAFAKITQEISVAGPDQGVEHSMDLHVITEFVRLRIGTTVNGDELVRETNLGQGRHNIAFIPPGASFWIELANSSNYTAVCDDCEIFQSVQQIVQFETGWNDEDDIAAVRWSQSGDVIYVISRNLNMQKIERRGYIDPNGVVVRNSWSLVAYGPEDGPFQTLSTDGSTVTVSAIEGDIQVQSSADIFDASMAPDEHRAGVLIRVASQGQVVTEAVNAADEFSPTIRVTGNGEARRFGIIIENMPPGIGTITVQFSIGSDSGPFNDLTPQYTSNTNTTFLDEQDGQIIFYRIGVKAGDFTAGPINCTLSYTGGSRTGIARMTGFTTSKLIDAYVIEPFGSLLASKDWELGEWSGFDGFPSTVDIHENRLWFAGNDRIYGSVSDNYESFDDETEGDSGPINRNIGSGPIRIINWLKSFGRLLLGTSENAADVDAARMDGNHPLGVRSSSFDEALTPTNFNIKTIASKGVFVDRTLQRLYELSYDSAGADYLSVDLSIFAPDYNDAGIRQIAVQMKPDVRVHCVRNDGTVGVLIYDRLENVICWCEVILGVDTVQSRLWTVDDVAILPGTVEDQVYYTVSHQRVAARKYLLKWALESEAVGGNNNYLGDAWGQYTGVPVSTVNVTTDATPALRIDSGHLDDADVSIWADGADKGLARVDSSGDIDLSLLTGAPFSNVIWGLPYTALFKSAKLGTLDGIGLLERKKVNKIGFIASDLHYQGLQYGPDFSNLSDLPLVEQGQDTPADTIWEDYHEDNFPFGGEWIPDSRICLQAATPRPATILAAIAEFESVEKRSNTKRRAPR